MNVVRFLLCGIIIICGISLEGRAQESQPEDAPSEKLTDSQGVLKEVWRTGVTSSLRDFEDLAGWSRPPDESEALPAMAFEEDTSGTAIMRLSTWFEAPESGDYVFWISSQGSSRLILSQPDALGAMGTGGLLFIKESLGWPQKGQWDLYPDQRCGPWTLEKGRRYHLEIWHAGKPGLKRCELLWSRAPGGGLENLAEGRAPEPGRVGAGGLFTPADLLNPLLPGNPPYDLSAPLHGLFKAAGDAVQLRLPEEKPVQRITILQHIRQDPEAREPLAVYKVVALNGKGAAVAQTTFRPEGDSPQARFEWELPSLMPVACVVLVLAEDSKLRENGSAPAPCSVEMWGPKDGKSAITAREAVAGTFLRATRKAAADLNGNGLPDDWEAQFGFGSLRAAPPVKSGETDYLAAGGDDDGDGLLNQMESLAGKDPFTPDPLRYRLTADYWSHVHESDVEGLVKSDAWFGRPDVRVVRFMERSSPLPQNHGLRLRGYITAPETGDYTFWIAARNAGEFWISEDGTKYRKHRVAWVSPHEGEGHGISRMAQNQWDQFPTQRSLPIPLKAGQTYYIEALAQQGDATAIGQLSLAWQKPGDSRRLLAGEALSTYLEEEGDADDDSLPDDWEKQYGLDPRDNGLTGRARQGERGDFDADGLTNLEEYQLGLDPSKADTDGDGKKDGDEVHSLHSDPHSAEENLTRVIRKIDPGSFSNSTMVWNAGPDGQGLTAGAYRGWSVWDFEVPEAGVYGYEFQLSLKGQVMAAESVPLRVRVDGVPVAVETVGFRLGQETTWRVLGPKLAAGPHQMLLAVENPMVARWLVIHSISLIQAGGLDADHDGVPDWCAAAQDQAYAVETPEAVSAVSPVCVEGSALENPEQVQINSAPVKRLGGRHWYADVPLQETGLTTMDIAFPGRPVQRRTVTWSRTNVLADAEIYLRAGDSLLLTATDKKGGTVQASCTESGGGAGSFTVKSTLVKTFTKPGVVTITGRSGLLLSGKLTVHVVQSRLPDRLLVLANLARAVSFEAGSLGAGTVVEGTPGLEAARRAAEAAAGAGGTSPNTATAADTVDLMPSEWGELALTSRLSPGGPILAVSQVDAVLIVDAVMQDATAGVFNGTPAGYYGLRAPITVLGMPDDASLEIRLARAGVMFADGGSMVRITTQDLVEGLYWLELFYPKDLTGGYCHYFTLRDRDGQVAGTR